MMQFFRKAIGSKVGAGIALFLLGLVALAFAAGDVERHVQSSGLFSSGSDSALTSDKGSLSAEEVQTRMRRAFDNARRDQPTLTMDQFFQQGGFSIIAGQLGDALALSAFADKTGMRLSKKLVDAEIAGTPAFQDARGQFSQQQFVATLARARVNEAALREDFTRQLLQRLVLAPAGGGAVTPEEMARRYASMLLEKREGLALPVPSGAFLPKTKPDDAAITRFFAQNGRRFALPEQRQVRYALIDIASLTAAATPTDAEIAAYYKANAAAYAASETRRVKQLVLISESAAKAVAAKLGGSGSLDAAAASAGLATTGIGPLGRAALAQQTGDDAATRIFAAAPGSLVGPVRTSLGWALFRIEEIKTIPARTLESARGEIVAKLTQAKGQQALASLAERLDTQIGNGATFDEVVKGNRLTAAQTPPLTADGRVLTAAPGTPADPNFASLAKAGFSMEADDDPQVVQIVPGARIALVAVGHVTPAGPPPLATIRPAVERAYLLSEGAKAAKAMAETLRAKAASGGDLAALAKAAGIPLPPAQPLGAVRGQLSQQGQQIPPALVELFSMKTGSARVISLPNDEGYGVIQLRKITPGDASANPQLVGGARVGMAQALGTEYAQQLVAALRKDVNVKRNEAAFARIAADLRKGGSAQ